MPSPTSMTGADIHHGDGCPELFYLFLMIDTIIFAACWPYRVSFSYYLRVLGEKSLSYLPLKMETSIPLIRGQALF